MIVWRNGLGGLVGAAKTLIKGVFSPRYSKTSIAVVAVGKPYSLTSIIETHGIGVLSTITASGQSVSSGIEQGIGLTSIMQSRGLGVASTITDSKGVSSDI